MAKPLAHYAARSGNRDDAITLAYSSGGYGMKEIGEYFGLHYSRVSKVWQKARPDPVRPRDLTPCARAHLPTLPA